MIQNGGNSIFYKSIDLNSIYGGLGKVFSMPKDKLFILRFNARKTVQAQYCINSSSQQYETIYKSKNKLIK